MKRFLQIIAIALCTMHCALCTLQAQPKREFRAAWLTTVWAIDWPTTWGDARKGAQQQAELYAIIDSLSAANMNAVFFQVRGFSDAMYNSKYEPWSKYLTGTRGGQPTYDPLASIVEYAHYKGIEVHAWLNPYRYATSVDTYGTLPTDYSHTHPEWLVDCGGITILNPSLPEVKLRVQEVVADIVEKYDVDGIIFDDYFYQSGYQNAYDDSLYTASGTTLSRANWRRAQVNEMVRMVHDTIKAIKPFVSFGIGPAGVAGKSNTSAPVYGVEGCPVGSDWQYNGIYSDPLAWYDQKTIDYMAPQLYWKIGSGTDYAQISEWWSYIASHFNRHCYMSQTLSGLKANSTSITSTTFHADEIGNQMQLDRDYDHMGAPGSAWYSLKTGMTTQGFIRYIRNNVNQHPALVPAMSWYRTDDCLYVSNITKSGNMLTWKAPAANLRYAVYCIPADSIGQPDITASSRYLLGTSYETSFELPAGLTGTYAVSVLDRFGNEFPVRTMDNTTWGTAPAVTNLTYPADGGAPLLPCYFSWQPVSGADSYFFQLSKNADFSTVDYEAEVRGTTFFLGHIEWIQPETSYYWRVRTRAINATDAYSAIRSFAGSYFHITSPTNNERDLSRTLTITTDSVADPSASYYFEIASNNSFEASKIVYTATTSVPHLTVPDSTLNASTMYYVRATVTFSGASATSDIVTFRTEALVVPVPTILSPADGETIYGTEVEVCWAEQLSSGFRVELATATSFAARVTSIGKAEQYTFCYTYSSVAPGTYYLRVKAVGDTGYTDPSPVVRIVVKEGTGIEDVAPAQKRDVQKYIENGQIVFIRDGEKYNVLGTRVE